MAKVLKKLSKLKGRSPEELRVRGAQALAVLMERHGLSGQSRVPTDAALFRLLDPALFVVVAPRDAATLLAHFRSRTSPRFFAAFDDREATLAELRRRFNSRAEEAVIERANRITRGRFDLLGLRDLSFGEPVDWHLEPRSGKRSGLTHWSRIDFLDREVAGDKKITWELNRHQYFMTLGRAYWLTGDEIYAQTFVAHLSAWMDSNPPKLGINWASSLEIAFRSIAWIWALYFFKDSTHLTPPVFARAVKFLYLHGRHLETYLSTYFSPNTHLTGEALGLFYLGTLLPEFRRASLWRATGKRILLAQLARHVRPDGVYFEQSSYYHRYTTDFYTHLCVLLRRDNGESVEPLLEERLTALLDHLMSITRPDGTTPFFGDDDGGRLVMLDERASNDFRAALATGAALFGRSDYKHVAAEAAEETLWLLGRAGLEAFDRIEARLPLTESRAFTGGGYYVMRDGWSRDSNYLLIDCGPHGESNCGHAHADALSFELAAKGRTLLVDPGTYTYTGAADMRDYFRSSVAHNTLTVDGESSSLPAGPFKWKQIAQAKPRAWISRRRFDYFEGEHDGYMRLDAPVIHTRSLLFLKGDYWIMRDHVSGSGEHRYDLRFHFAECADPVIEAEGERDGAARERPHAAPGLEIFAFAADGSWRKEDGWVSRCYGEMARAPVCVYSTEAKGATDFITLLLPRKAEQPAACAHEREATGGRAFLIEDENGCDTLMVGAGSGSRVETDRFLSDFGWTWVRLARYADVWKELVLVDGQQLDFNGCQVFKAARRIGYLAISHDGEELNVETDADCEWTLRPPRVIRRIKVNGESFAVGEATTLSFVDGRLRSEDAAMPRAEEAFL